MRPTGAYPNMLITTGRLPRRRNLATHSLFQRMCWRSTAQDINNFRASLGLAPVTTATATRLAASRTLELQAYHSALVPDLADYPTHRPVIGFLSPDRDLRERLGELNVDPETDAWLTDGEPPVIVGFGSMPCWVSGPRRGALADLDRRRRPRPHPGWRADRAADLASAAGR